MRASAAAAAILAAALSSPAQTPKTPPEGKPVTESTSVTAIEIPVNVVGRDGRPIPNLKAENFELYDEGKRQEISALDVVDLLSIPMSEAPAIARRHWLLVFDLTYTSPKGLTRARAGARDFVERATAASDLVGVATLSVESGWKLLANFTRDRAQLAHAVSVVGTPSAAVAALDPLGFQLVVPGADSGSGVTSGSDKNAIAQENARDIGRALQRGSDSRERGRIAQLVGTLGGVARTLDSVRGRKHVLFFSEGFESRLLAGSDRAAAATGETRSAPGDETANEQSVRGQTWNIDNDERFGSSSSRSRVGETLAVFRRSDTVLHAVDVTGLTNSAGDASDVRGRNGRDSLFLMARETDGELVKNANELSGELKKVADRTSLVYVLVYRPKKLEKPGAYHALRVKVDAPGARVSARAGYYEPRPFAVLSPIERQLATGDLLTGGGPNSLSLTLLVAPFPAEPDRALVPVILELPGSSLLAGAAGPQIPVQLYTYAIDSTGTMRDHATQEFTLDLTKLRSVLETGGIKYYATLSLPPGDFVIRAVARNVATGRAGDASAALTVPTMPGGAAFVVTPLFHAQPAGWLLVKRPPAATQPNPDYPFAVGAETFIPAAAPVLDSATETRISLVTYNFGGGAVPPPLDLALEVTDAAGKTWPGTLKTLGQTRVEKGAARKFLLSFQPAGLPPGKYRMKISVSEKASGASAESTASFEVRGPVRPAAAAASAKS